MEAMDLEFGKGVLSVRCQVLVDAAPLVLFRIFFVDVVIHFGVTFGKQLLWAVRSG